MKILSIILLPLLLFGCAGSSGSTVAYYKNIPNVYLDKNVPETIKDRIIIWDLHIATLAEDRACLYMPGLFPARRKRSVLKSGVVDLCHVIDASKQEHRYEELLRSFIVLYNELTYRQFNALHRIVITETISPQGKIYIRLTGTLVEFE